MKRTGILFYGTTAYLLFLVTFVHAMLFVQRVLVPRTLDSGGVDGPVLTAVLVNAGLLGLFAVQHSIMARRWFKVRWTKIVHPAIERSTFVLITNVILTLIIAFWRPIPAVVWEVGGAFGFFLDGLSWAGWGLVLVATLLIDHFDLFGLKQVIRHFRGQQHREPAFQVHSIYRWTRHPLYLGFFLAFWCTPVMTVGHLLFAGMVTTWVLLTVQLEERDLVAAHGDAYREYRAEVPMIVPRPRAGYGVVRSEASTQVAG